MFPINIHPIIIHSNVASFNAIAVRMIHMYNDIILLIPVYLIAECW